MTKRIWLLLAVLATIGLGAAYWAVEMAHPSNGTQLTLLPQSDNSLTWPANHVWTWKFSLPPDAPARVHVSLDIREKARPGEWPQTEWPHKVLQPSDADHVFPGGIINSSVSKSGLACIQLIDLAEAGIQSTTQPSNLRVLATLGLGGASAIMGPAEIHLPPGHLAAYICPTEGNWTNGELYLMTFEVQEGGGFYQYDAVLKIHNGD
ncbi:MAG TPA: hypothetical protein VMD30_00630 [Tepidisphaeraceae bacterium]|nr:hypothetical protein [Tepidisphaeraceae bacterium]